MKQFKTVADISGKPIDGSVPISDAVYFRVTTANTPVNITVPSGAGVAVFNCKDPFWVAEGTDAAEVPTVDSNSASEFLPVIRAVEPGDILSIVTDKDSNIYVSFYTTFESSTT